MKFIQKCNELIELHEKDCLLRKNGTMLLNPGKIPVARYILHAGLDAELIEEYLVKAYKFDIPEEYVRLLSSFNGMSLYLIKMNYNESISFAISRLSVFGLPLTPTSKRSEYGEEAYDVRMMDLERHKNIPQNWLKVASYRKFINEDVFYDIFIDTESQRVFLCKRMESIVDQEWASLDECLCDIFDILSSTEWEVNWDSQ